MRHLSIALSILCGAMLASVSVSMAQVKLDYLIVKSFESKCSSIKESIKHAGTVQECANVSADIDVWKRISPLIRYCLMVHCTLITIINGSVSFVWNFTFLRIRWALSNLKVCTLLIWQNRFGDYLGGSTASQMTTRG